MELFAVCLKTKLRGDNKKLLLSNIKGGFNLNELTRFSAF